MTHLYKLDELLMPFESSQEAVDTIAGVAIDKVYTPYCKTL